ncbi:hypothetical protein GGI11_007576 [Coemansia sp. RSA 2049]|nr:hypothetical protein GGI11_007576 [Coemansia sp. RSA 2049]KAJ2521281.1 hypothetical protein H4217_001492 [Coemansia sp. RSA 1939]KAJ2694890.1 hypothetical protein GGH99_000440 [Coemansia sp. RSA 1285]
MADLVPWIRRRRTPYTVDDKVVLVTGALSTVGRKLVSRLVDMGARVVLVDSVSDGTGELLSEEINKRTRLESTVYVRTSSADEGQLHGIRVMVDAAVLTFGRLDVLVNNAQQQQQQQIQQQGGGPVGTEDLDLVCDTIDANFRAPVLATRVFERYLRQAGDQDGVVVNVAAMAGLLPGAGREVYGAANAGLIHFTEASRAMAPRLRVCALAPYYVDHGSGVSPPIALGDNQQQQQQRLGAPLRLLALSSDQVVASVVRCIEDTRLAGKTLLIAGDSSYVSSWASLLLRLHMACIMAWSALALVAQRLLAAVCRRKQPSAAAAAGVVVLEPVDSAFEDEEEEEGGGVCDGAKKRE